MDAVWTCYKNADGFVRSAMGLFITVSSLDLFPIASSRDVHVYVVNENIPYV